MFKATGSAAKHLAAILCRNIYLGILVRTFLQFHEAVVYICICQNIEAKCLINLIKTGVVFTVYMRTLTVASIVWHLS
jgi:hypothetical protein